MTGGEKKKHLYPYSAPKGLKILETQSPEGSKTGLRNLSKIRLPIVTDSS